MRASSLKFSDLRKTLASERPWRAWGATSRFALIRQLNFEHRKGVDDPPIEFPGSPIIQIGDARDVLLPPPITTSGFSGRANDLQLQVKDSCEILMRILLIEDDGETARLVSDCLTKQGHQVDVSADGLDGLKQATVGAFDVLVVDRMLPGLDGLNIVRSLRRADITSGILFLTAVGGIEDRIEGFESGADDYLVKPFALGELVARVTALGRRPPSPKQDFLFRIDDLEVNLVRHEVRRGGEIIHLQPREFKMLEILLKNRGRVVTRSMILEQMWGLESDTKTSIVQTNVSRLRLKIDRPGDTPLIRTVRGLGYIIDHPL